jgi:hypothetical protein
VKVRNRWRGRITHGVKWEGLCCSFWKFKIIASLVKWK